MSQSSRSHVLARVRWREQTAKLLARSLAVAAGQITYMPREVPGSNPVHALLDGDGHFDVYAARELGKRLVAMADEQACFEDWCRDRGRGPESSRTVAAVRRQDGHVLEHCDCADWDGEPDVWRGDELMHKKACHRMRHHGGWPGKLGREYVDAMVKCQCDHGWVQPTCGNPKCDDGVLTGSFEDNVVNALNRGEVTVTSTSDGGIAVACSDCPRRASCPACRDARKRFSRAPMGRSMARVGQRLLDMLDGRCAWAPSARPQPSECQSPSCVHARLLARAARRPSVPAARCPDCKGTGHNLRGFVPEIEWPACAWLAFFLSRRTRRGAANRGTLSVEPSSRPEVPVDLPSRAPPIGSELERRLRSRR